MPGGECVTACYAFIDKESRIMKYPYAGHMTAYHWKGNGGPMACYGAAGRTMSTRTSPRCTIRIAPLDSGARGKIVSGVFFFTDYRYIY
jgi:hypothetical protein